MPAFPFTPTWPRAIHDSPFPIPLSPSLLRSIRGPDLEKHFYVLYRHVHDTLHHFGAFVDVDRRGVAVAAGRREIVDFHINAEDVSRCCRTLFITAVGLANVKSVCPPSRSMTASDAPLYGTWVMRTPATVLN